MELYISNALVFFSSSKFDFFLSLWSSIEPLPCSCSSPDFFLSLLGAPFNPCPALAIPQTPCFSFQNCGRSFLAFGDDKQQNSQYEGIACNHNSQIVYLL